MCARGDWAAFHVEIDSELYLDTRDRESLSMLMSQSCKSDLQVLCAGKNVPVYLKYTCVLAHSAFGRHLSIDPSSLQIVSSQPDSQLYAPSDSEEESGEYADLAHARPMSAVSHPSAGGKSLLRHRAMGHRESLLAMESMRLVERKRGRCASEP